MTTLTDPDTEALEPTWEGNSADLSPGQRITCEAMHTIATAKVACTPGKDDWMSKVRWTQDPPQEGAPSVCRVCGRVWLLTYCWPSNRPPLIYRKSWVCIEGTWSSPLTPAARKYLDSQPTKDN